MDLTLPNHDTFSTLLNFLVKVRRSFEEAELEAMMAAESQQRATKDNVKSNVGKYNQV